MNSFVVAVCVCLTVLVSVKGELPRIEDLPGEGEYVWDVVVQQGPDDNKPLESVLGSVFMIVRTATEDPIEVPLDGFYASYEGKPVAPGWKMKANEQWDSSFKSNVNPSSITSAQFEWRWAKGSVKTPKNFSIQKVIITERKTGEKVAFCADEIPVPSGTKVNALKCAEKIRLGRLV